MTGDISESDYGLGDYGDGYYSLRPIWLFDATARVLVNADALAHEREGKISLAFRLWCLPLNEPGLVLKLLVYVTT